MLPRAVTARVAYVSGTGFYADGLGSRQLRLSYCYPTPERIREGVRRLAGVVEAELELHADVRQPGAARRRSPGPQALAGHDLSPEQCAGDLTAASPRPTSWTRTVAVLAGGLSHEREVSLRSGRRLCDGAARRRLAVRSARRRRRAARADCGRSRPDAVVIALHGGEGEDGVAAGGARAARRAVRRHRRARPAGARGTSRPRRPIWPAPGSHTPDWVALPHATFRELGAPAVLDAIVERLGLPLMLKPDQGGSALGAQVVADAAELPAAMVAAWRTATPCWRSGSSQGVEVAVSVVEDGDGAARAAPGRDRAEGRRLRLRRALHGRKRPPSTARPGWTTRSPTRCEETALAAHRLLGLRDVSRTDASSPPTGGAVPGGQRLAGHDRHLAAADGGGRRGHRPRRALRTLVERAVARS